MRSAILILTFLLAPIVALPKVAATEDVLVLAKHIDKVENPRELERSWKDTTNPAILETVKEMLPFTGCADCPDTVIEFIDDVKVEHLRDAGEEHVGAIKAPDGYTVCRAYVISPSVNCNGTFTGSYRRANDPGSGKIDGLHYYIVVPRSSVVGGRCWVEGTIVITFIEARAGNPLRSKCANSGEIAFHYGK